MLYLMKLVVAGLLVACAAFSQPAPKILTPDQIAELERVPPTPPNQQLLGTNYALIILGVTSIDARGLVDGADPLLTAGALAAHARQVLESSQSAPLLGH